MKMFEDKYIIITGGAGFIGSAVLRHLNEQGLKNYVIVDDLGTSQKWKNLVGKRFLEFVPRHQVFDWLKGKERDIEAFIHLGACSDTQECDAQFLVENNTLFSIKLAEFALEHDHRFIYASSAATYGSGEQGFSDDHTALESLAPLNMYGYSKHLFDLWVKDQNVLDKVVGLKYFNVYGPNEYHKGKMASAITKMVPDALEKGMIRLFKSNDPNYKDGEQMRDFIYIKDVAKMTADFLTNDLCGIYNIGQGAPHTWNALAHAVTQALDKVVKIEYIDMPQVLVGKYQNFTKADMTKGQKAGVVQPSFSLEAGVKDYIQNYLLPEKRW